LHGLIMSAGCRVTVQEYRSQTAIIHTLRGAVLWVAAWTTLTP
jgi:hypothetical protein